MNMNTVLAITIDGITVASFNVPAKLDKSKVAAMAVSAIQQGTSAAVTLKTLEFENLNGFGN